MRLHYKRVNARFAAISGYLSLYKN